MTFANEVGKHLHETYLNSDGNPHNCIYLKPTTGPTIAEMEQLSQAKRTESLKEGWRFTNAYTALYTSLFKPCALMWCVISTKELISEQEAVKHLVKQFMDFTILAKSEKDYGSLEKMLSSVHLRSNLRTLIKLPLKQPLVERVDDAI